jgi:hypothetical protein
VRAPSLDEPDLGYTLLSDSKLNDTRAFGLAFTPVEETHFSGMPGEGVWDVTMSWAERDGTQDATRCVSFEVKPIA